MNDRQEVVRIVLSMTVACAVGAAVLGGVYLGTDRYQQAAQLRGDRTAIVDLLGLGEGADVTEVRQYLTADAHAVVYDISAFGAPAGATRRLEFSLDGQLVSQGVAPSAPETGGKGMLPLGRIFVARRDGATAGFVVEGNTRGYKNRIRFLIGLTPSFDIAGVRVVEHEEDPGLGAEVATPWFTGQFIDRAAADLPTLTVTRDPMPEDWRSALAALSRTPIGPWRAREAALITRERAHPIYAVTGATISSRALTDGVRQTVDHFRRRWRLLEPLMGAAS
jgi:electron transport complex protein RnfG